MVDRYSVIYDNSLISKNGRGYEGFDLSFLPDDVLAIQIYPNGEADVEKGDRVSLAVFENEFIEDVTKVDWWSDLKAIYDERENIDRSACLSNVVFSEGFITPQFRMFEESIMNVHVDPTVESVTVTAWPVETGYSSTIKLESKDNFEELELTPGEPSPSINIPVETGQIDILLKVDSEIGHNRGYGFTIIKQT